MSESRAADSGHQINDQPEPFPTAEPESDLSTDYSDIRPAANLRNSSKQRRKYQRGGRKVKKGGVKSVSELEIPARQDDEAFEEEEKAPKPTNPTLKHRGSNPPFETGIKAFNIRRAESSGGRPFGVSVEKQGSKSKPKAKAKQKSKCKACGRRTKQIPDVEGSGQDGWESENTSENTSEAGEGDDDEDQEHEEQEEQVEEPKKPKKPKKKKPMAIRLDLNLELEIFLRAKVKGDVTITFLE